MSRTTFNQSLHCNQTANAMLEVHSVGYCHGRWSQLQWWGWGCRIRNRQSLCKLTYMLKDKLLLKTRGFTILLEIMVYSFHQDFFFMSPCCILMTLLIFRLCQWTAGLSALAAEKQMSRCARDQRVLPSDYIQSVWLWSDSNFLLPCA